MTDDLVQARIAALRREACAFFGLTEEELLARVTNPHEAIAAEWEGKRAKTTEEFYQQSSATIWSWLQWAECEWVYGWPQSVAAKVRELDCESVLDFGCGVGEVGLYVAEETEARVLFYDLPGPSVDFLLSRLQQRQKPDELRLLFRLAPSPANATNESFDAILCLEVIEHIPDAPDVLRKLLSKCRKAFCISGALGRPPNDPDPLHVYKVSLLPVFEEAGWKLLSGGGQPWWFGRR